ncbi:MAG: GspE/PulE family protein, partial [Wujia sp.]
MRITSGRKKIRIGDLLVEAGAITEEELQEAITYQKENGGKLGNVIMNLGFISQDLLITVLTTQMGIDFIELKACKLDEDILRLVPENLINKYKAVPIGFDETNPNILRVAMVDPMDLNAIDDIGIATNTQVEPLLAMEDDVNETIGKYFGNAQAMEAAEQYRKEMEADGLSSAEEEQLNEDIENSPVVLLVKQIMEGGVRQRASDIHIEPLEQSVRVRYRIDGALKQVMSLDYSLLAGISARIKIIGGMDIAEKRKPQDGR